jgi:hypothetical protein
VALRKGGEVDVAEQHGGVAGQQQHHDGNDADAEAEGEEEEAPTMAASTLFSGESRRAVASGWFITIKRLKGSL